jgi:hypothetical protein
MEETKRCPFCAEEILSAAVKCKHCGSALNEKAAAPSNDAPRRKGPLATIIKGSVLVLLAVIAVFVVSAIYAGHLRGARAIAAVKERLGANIDVQIYAYKRGDGEQYVCGMAFPKHGPISAGKLFYVVEKGMFPTVTSAGIEGGKDFPDMYEFTCGNSSSASH